MKTRHIIKTALFFFILLFPLAMQAQPGFGDDTSDGAGAPIDGGLSILLAAGVGYGVKKAYQKRKDQRQMTGLGE